MNKPQHISIGLPQHYVLDLSKNIRQSFITDISKFEEFDPELDLAFSDKLALKINEVEAIKPDYVMRALLMTASKNVYNLSTNAIAIVRTIKYYVEKAFKDDHLYLFEFGYPELNKVINSQLKILLFLKNYVITLNNYKTELFQKGLSQTCFDEILLLASQLDTALIAQEQAKKARYICTGKRIRAYDQLWEMVGEIAKAGKIIFDKEPDQLRYYILDRTSKKVTVKVNEKEINAAVFQGMVIDAITKEAIEDAIVEIAATGYNDTTDKSGKFYIDEIVPGSYTFIIKTIGYKEIEQKDMELTSDNIKQEFIFALEKLSID
jgi:hypothetical protein